MKRYIITAATLALCTLAAAQTFNPTVVVTNTYEGTLEANKKDLPVNLPDSLSKFDLDFDYSVFTNPYKGSYEFRPYEMNMKPDASVSQAKSFYLSAGVGLPLHPELDVAWSPALNGRFQIGVYDQFRGYLGKYRYFTTALGQQASFPLESGHDVSGHDFANLLGITGRYEGDQNIISFGLGYRMISASDSVETHTFNAFTADARVRSRFDPEDPLSYDAFLGVSLGGDGLNWANNFGTSTHFQASELDVNVGANVMYSLSPNLSVGADAGVDVASLSMTLQGYAAQMFVTPQVVWTNGPARFKAGVKLSSVIHEDQTDVSYYEMYGMSPGFLFPDISASYRLLDGRLTLFTDVTGGNHLNTLSELFEKNHFYNVTRTKTLSSTLDTSVELLNISAGLRGSVSSYLQYDFRAGYSRTKNGLMDLAFLEFTNGALFNIFGTFTYADYDMKYTQASLLWESRSMRISLGGRYQDTKLIDEDALGILPAAWLANGSVQYNYNRRIFVGVTGDFASARSGLAPLTRMQIPMVLEVPSYFDLGAYARFDLSDRLGAWGKVGNILNQDIQRTLLHSERGLYFTGGICLNF